MRLTEKEIQKLLSVFSKNISNLIYSIYLFGSRVDDLKKGGDIDLLLVVSEPDFKKAQAQKSVLKFDLEKIMKDQRIDLTITTNEKMEEDIFLQSVKDKMISLYSSHQVTR